MCPFQTLKTNGSTLDATGTAAQPAVAATWRELLVAQASALDTFIVCLMVGNDQASAGRAYLEAVQAQRAVRGAAGAIGWQFGVALAQAGEVACRAVAKGGRSAALRLLGQALEPLSEDLGHALLLAAMRRITMDEAAMLLSLPPAEANARVVTAMLAAHRD